MPVTIPSLIPEPRSNAPIMSVSEFSIITLDCSQVAGSSLNSLSICAVIFLSVSAS